MAASGGVGRAGAHENGRYRNHPLRTGGRSPMTVDPMEWLGLSTQGQDFHDIDSIATPLYEAASQKLEELETRYQDHEHEANSEEEHEQLWQAAERWKAEHLSRKQALGSIALHLLQLSVIERLERAKRYFDKSSSATEK